MICAKTIARFEKYIIKIHGECWEWLAGKSSRGYPKFYMMNAEAEIPYPTKSGRMECGNRVSFRIYKGPIPAGMKIRHTCDNPGCINPDHLIPGTQKQNMEDMVSRGRAARGERCGSCRLTDAQVAAIRLDTRVLRLVAADYPVSLNTIAKIRRGESRVLA
jgi:hypothetical protein